MPYKDYEKTKENARQNYYANKEQKLAQVKEYYYANWEKKQEQRAAWIAANPEKVALSKLKYNRKYYSENKEKVRAHNVIRWAVKSGKVTKPDRCSKCNESSRLHAHHHQGYGEENNLNILWLCGSCHRKEHNNV